MKQVLHLLSLAVLMTLLSVNVFAQAPEGVNYQAIVRNNIGEPLLNQAVQVQFTIRQTNPTGVVVFQELHSTTTNQFGLVNLQIGSVNTATFPTINWGTGTYFLQVEIDDGTGMQDLGATQLLSVPYALYAKTAGNGPQGLSSLLDTTNAGLACPNGGYEVLMGLDANSNMVLDAGEISSSFVVCNGVDGVANVSDTSATNELQTISISNDTVFLSNGGFVVLPSASGDNDWQPNGSDLTLDPSITGNVGIGTSNPFHKLSVNSSDSIVASFFGTNPDISAIALANTNPNAAVGTILLTGADTGFFAVEPIQKLMIMKNTTPGGHISISSDSTITSDAKVVSNIAGRFLYNQTDTIYNTSPTGTIFNVNQGSFLTDSLYVLGNNVSNFNWVLANDGFGQAVWTDPSTLGGGSSLWNTNGSGIDYTAGNVGIGTTNPTATLTINSVAGTDIEFAGGFNADIHSNAQLFLSSFGPTIIDASEIRLGTATFDRLTILNNGNIGVGTTTPSTLLEIAGITTTDSLIVTTGGGTLGNVLTDDGTGNAVWAAPPTVSPGNDTSLVDADGDTHVNVEAAPDQDVIHFNLGNSTGYPSAEYFTMIGPRLEVINSGNSVFIGQGAGANDDLNFRNNTYIGHLSGNANTNGSSNVGIGPFTLQNNATGNYNIAIGDDAFQNNTGGSNNVAIGVGSGFNNITGSGNVFIGHQAGMNEVGSNHLFIDNSNTNTPLIWGDFALNLLQLNGTVNINNAYTLPSSDGATSGQVLTTDAAGNVTWQLPAGGNGIYGGSNSLSATTSVTYGSNNLIFSQGNGSTFFNLNNGGGDFAVQVGGTSQLRVYDDGDVRIDGQTFVVDNASARIGVGTPSPGEKLHIFNGTLRIDDGANPYTLPPSDGATSGQVLTTDAAGNVTWQTPAGGSSPWTRSGGDVFQTTLTDFVGVGTNTPTEMLSIGSQGTATSVATQQSSNKLALTGSFWNGGGVVSHDFTIHNEASTSTGEEGRLSIGWSGSGTELFSISSYGSIGFGTAPSTIAKLATLSTNHQYVIEGTNVFASSLGNTSYGVYGNSVGSSTGNNAGVFGNASGAAVENTGVMGIASGSGTGTAYAIRGEIDPSSGGTNYSLYGIANSTNGTSNYGVYATASGGAANFAGFFDQGNVQINNTLVLPNGAGQGRILTSDAAGNAIWKEKRIAFEVVLTNSLTIPLGGFGSGSILVPFNGEVFDDGNDFTPATTHEFTAKVPGVYSIQVGVTFAHLGGGEIISSIGLVKNGNSNNPIKVSSTVLNSPGQRKTAIISATIRLIAGDKLTVESVINTTGAIDIQPSENNWFSGHLVYAD